MVKQIKLSFLFMIIIFILVFFGTSCTARASLSVNADNSAGMIFKTQAGKTLEQTLAAFTGTAEDTLLVDEKAVRKTFADAGFELNELKLSGKTDIFLKARIADINKNGAGDILKTEKGPQGESLIITFNPKTVNMLLKLLPEETAEYTELLMSPLFTGEQMNASEYAELIGAMYGKAIRSDLEGAVFVFDIDVPSQITDAFLVPSDAGNVRIDGKKASFNLYLNKFLSNSLQTIIRIQWKK